MDIQKKNLGLMQERLWKWKNPRRKEKKTITALALFTGIDLFSIEEQYR